MELTGVVLFVNLAGAPTVIKLQSKANVFVKLIFTIINANRFIDEIFAFITIVVPNAMRLDERTRFMFVLMRSTFISVKKLLIGTIIVVT